MKFKWNLVLILTNAVTLGILLYLMLGGAVRSQSGDLDDPRTVVYLEAPERALLLGEMRMLLAATQGVLQKLNDEEFQGAAKIASSVGMRMAREVGGEHLDIIRKLPVEMRTLGFSVHRDFDALAVALRTNTPDAASGYRQIADTMAKCVACHSMYRLETEAEPDVQKSQL